MGARFYSAALQNFLIGRIYQIVIYNGVLSDPQRAQVRTYVGAKAGLVV